MPEKVAPSNQVAPEKVALWNLAALPENVAPLNPAAPEKTAAPNLTSPVKAVLSNSASPEKVAPSNQVAPEKVASSAGVNPSAGSLLSVWVRGWNRSGVAGCGRGRVVIRIGMWNVENLFRPGGEFGPRTDEEYRRKLAALASVIAAMAPDVLAVQEVGGDDALGDLADQVGGVWNRQTADPDGRGIRVGLLSRLPLTSVGQVREFPAGLRPVQVDDTAARFR